MTRIAVLGMGSMGSAVAARLVRGGAQVQTWLEGRGEASRERARHAGVEAADAGTLASADYLLSIVPPQHAAAVAREWAPRLRAQGGRTVYLDCNAVSLETSASIGRTMADAGLRYVDACIIGHPGVPGDRGPAVYLSGETAEDAATLARLGLRVRSTGAAAGAASALKMAYAGFNKGLTGLAAAMVVAAARTGAAQALHEELRDSQPGLLAHIGQSLPDMYSKAWRWDFEMQEVARFATACPDASPIYEGMAAFFAHFGRDFSEARSQADDIDRFLAKGRP